MNSWSSWIPLAAGVLFVSTGSVQASDEAVYEALKARQGKSATVVLTSGTELTGKVSSLTQDGVRLSELSGKEFFDAVVDLDQVQAVVFRAREQ